MSDKMREEFEAWFESAVKAVEEKIPANYSSAMRFCKETMWHGWQASRESLVIELPENHDVFTWSESGITILDSGYSDGAITKAIEAAGLKVKP